MNKVLLTAAAVVTLGACATGGPEVFTETVRTMRANLNAQNNSGIQGAAAVNTGAGQTGVSITVWGAQSGQTLPWHIHTGTCGSGGGIVGMATAYSPINVGGNGQGSASATPGVELNPAERYHVNVHRSPTDLGTIVACGNLQ